MKTKLFILLIVASLLFCACNDINTEGTQSGYISIQNETDTVKPTTEETICETVSPTVDATDETVAPTEEPTPPVDDTQKFPAIEYSDSGYLPKVLMYHLVLEEPYNYNVGLFVRPTDLEDQIKTLLDEGYIFLFADEYGKTKEKSVILTFDDGYTDNYTELLPILEKYNVKATVFLIGDLVNNHHEYLTREQIKSMAESGYIQFGCHTMSHPYLEHCGEEQIRQEYEGCISLIKEFTGQECKTIAYPYGSYNDSVTKITMEYFDFAYNSGYYTPDNADINYHISRYYVERGIDGAGLLAMIS